jgi:hypothetical protein
VSQASSAATKVAAHLAELTSISAPIGFDLA